MTIQRITPVAVLLAAVLAMGAGIARAQETVNIAIPVSAGISSSTDFITITGAVNGTRTFTGSCMAEFGFGSGHKDLKAVVLDRSFPPAATVLPSVFLSSPLPPGTRLIDFRIFVGCTDGGTTFNIYQGTIVSPQNQTMALVTTPTDITLAADHEAIVGAGTDELGSADAVCVKKGSQSLKTEIISDILLEAGDRLTDFLELDYNPDTGETLYGAWLEY